MAVVFILALVGAVVIMGIAKAKTRMHHANEMRATRALIAGEGPDLPSWYEKRDELEIFSSGVVNLAQRKGIPAHFTKVVLSNPNSNRPIFSYAAKLEKQGSSFTEQQIGTVQFLFTTWSELNSVEKAKLTNLLAAQS